LVIAFAAALAVGVAACGGDDETTAGSGDSGGDLSGSIRIDGSSTVAPLSEPMAELFNEENSGVNITVGTSGTGGGFEKFCNGETDISDASRAIEPDEEKACEENGIEFEEVVVANDALSVVVNPDNPIACLSVEQVGEIYGPKATATNWDEIKGLEAGFDEDLEIFSPGADSGTFDYFTDAINGEEGAQRSKNVNVVGENDNATVTGVAGSPGGIGYFGYSFYNENRDKLKALEIENPESGECVEPAPETTQSGEYAPLGRQLYIYPSAQALEKPEVLAFVEFYLENVNEVTEQAGFIALTEEQLGESEADVEALTSGGGE
jgi:phosphate transport system substrate-binding protein